jgi:uncharacterized membrane protein
MVTNKFWTVVHGGSTHFPIALLIASLIFDVIGYAINREKTSRELHTASFYSLILGALASFVAMISGLMLVNWQTLGRGKLLLHHEFVWPAFGLLVALAVWRLIVRDRASRSAFGIYLAAAFATTVVMSIAGYWGGELR